MSGGKISPAMLNAVGRVQRGAPAPTPAQPLPYQAQTLDPRNNAWAQMKAGLLGQQAGQRPMPGFYPGGKIPPYGLLGQGAPMPMPPPPAQMPEQSMARGGGSRTRYRYRER